jgi:16S rRNA G1207 methylase RsmC
VRLEVLEGVFASAAVDAGTRHLLRWLAGERFSSVGTVLDVGCGYGPLGLWLAAARPDRWVTAVDRDARALEATTLGAAANGSQTRVEALGSLGYDALAGRTFDLVVSNIPAKVGPAALSHLLLDACHCVAPGGQVAVVVVDRLAAAVGALLDDPSIEVVERHPSRAYTAFVYRFVGVPAGASADAGFDRGAYRRGRESFRAGPLRWDADVSHDLAEFDTLSHGTLAALELVTAECTTDGAGTTVVVGVGQGHLALGLRQVGAGDVRLVDRDLLALRTSASNLAGQGDPPAQIVHAGRLRAEHLAAATLAVVALPEREPVAVTAAVLGAALAGLDPTAAVVLHGRTSDAQRVLELVPRHGARLEVTERRRVAGHTAARARRSVTPPA